MRIESIKLKNYKAFQNIELNYLPELAIFVGANGVGKTTLFDAFGFLSDSLKHNIRQALVKRGGFKEVLIKKRIGDPLEHRATKSEDFVEQSGIVLENQHCYSIKS